MQELQFVVSLITVRLPLQLLTKPRKKLQLSSILGKHICELLQAAYAYYEKNIVLIGTTLT